MRNMLNSMNLRELFVKKSILSPQEGDFFSKCRLVEKTKSGKYDIKKRLFNNTLKSRYSTFVLQKKRKDYQNLFISALYSNPASFN